nr:PREDICTED: bromodomain-containing protein 4-like [Bos mutus]
MTVSCCGPTFSSFSCGRGWPPLPLPPSVLPDHREPPRDLRAPLHAPHLRALPPPSLLRPLQPAGGLLPPHHLLPHVLPGRGLPPLLLGHHVLPAHLCAVPVLPAHLLPARPLPHHLPHLLSSALPAQSKQPAV